MSSSRSIQAARNRRAGDSRLQTSSNIAKKPTTSINSQRVFSGQMAQNNNMATMGSNEPTQVSSNGLPFNKLTISDAIGLITLRLGKVEQYLMDFQHNDKTSGTSEPSSTGIDTTIFNNLVKRIDDLENNSKVTNLEKSNNTLINEIKSLKVQINKIQNELNLKISDIENAFIELEKNIDVLSADVNTEANENDEILVSSVENELNVEDGNEMEEQDVSEELKSEDTNEEVTIEN